LRAVDAETLARQDVDLLTGRYDEMLERAEERFLATCLYSRDRRLRYARASRELTLGQPAMSPGGAQEVSGTHQCRNNTSTTAHSVSC
jgi:hypothetical protein